MKTGDKVKGKGVRQGFYGNIDYIGAGFVDVIITRINPGMHGNYAVGGLLTDPDLYWELDPASIISQFKVGDSVRGKLSNTYIGYAGTVVAIHPTIGITEINLSAVPPGASFQVGDRMSIFDQYIELDNFIKNPITFKSFEVLINKPIKQIPAKRIEKPCRLKSCSRMNDVGVKSCWHCGLENPNQ